MLKGFYFKDGQIGFKNKMLLSDEYKNSVLNDCETSTEINDNGNVTVFPLGKNGNAMTESAVDCQFNTKTLETIGHTPYKGELDAHMTLAHWMADTHSDKYINVAIQFGETTQYFIYSIDPISLEQTVLAKHQSAIPFYLHSFSVTQSYFIMYQSPITINLEAMMTGGDFSEFFIPKEGAPTQFIIINRQTGEETIIKYDEFVCFHQANSYDEDDNIILDLCTYNSVANYDDLSFSKLINKSQSFSESVLNRYSIDIKTKQVTCSQLSTYNTEFPRIASDKLAGKKHQYIYACGMSSANTFFDRLLKVDVNSSNDLVFSKENLYFGEPIFIRNPSSDTEDDGVIVSLAFDAAENRSLLILLDAQSFTELAHAYLPIPIPFGLHGEWFPE